MSTPIKNENTAKNPVTNTTDVPVNKHGTFMRIFAIFGIVLILGLYLLSFIAAISDWENSFGIFTGALGASIFVPIVIYLIKLFSDKSNK